MAASTAAAAAATCLCCSTLLEEAWGQAAPAHTTRPLAQGTWQPLLLPQTAQAAAAAVQPSSSEREGRLITNCTGPLTPGGLRQLGGRSTSQHHHTNSSGPGPSAHRAAGSHTNIPTVL